MTTHRYCSGCVKEILDKQLGRRVLAFNATEFMSGELVGVSMNGKQLTVILCVFPKQFQVLPMVRQLFYQNEAGENVKVSLIEQHG